MILPTAMVVGPMKAGTTWIHDYLATRDDVAVPAKVKETFFFERNFHRGIEWYAGHFERGNAAGVSAVVEVAPSLFDQTAAPARVKAALGDVPIVVTTRDPIARSWSHYLHLRRYGLTNKPLEEAVADFPEIILASNYDTVLANWNALFSSVHVLPLELLKSDRDAYARELCAALSVPEVRVPGSLSGASNEAAEPYSATLARLGNAVAHGCRSAGMYQVVNFAKRIGLKEVFFGSPSGARPLPEPTDADRQFIADQLENVTCPSRAHA